MSIEEARIAQALGNGVSLAVARNGNKYSVAYAAEGDHAKIAVSARNPDRQATLLEVVSKGHGRVEPLCPLYFRPGREKWCGGCDMQHLSYQAQLHAKQTSLETLLRTCRATARIKAEPITPSPQQWRYRNKVQVPFARRGGRYEAGFYHPGTHDVVDFQDCPVQPELSTKIILDIKKTAREHRWPIYDEELNTGWLRHALVRTNVRGEAMVSLVAAKAPQRWIRAWAEEFQKTFPQVKSLYLNTQPGRTSVILGKKWERLAGATTITETICGLDFMLYPGSFLQVNTPAAELLYRTAASFLRGGLKTPDFYDLYCGTGTITLIASRLFRNAVGIEENKGAVACAWKNAERNRIGNARFFSGKAEELFNSSRINRPCSVLVDPPRTGCDKSLLLKLKHPHVKKLVYISCNPQTFVRDADILAMEGFELKRLRPADLFPQTSHIELAALFERSRE
ncbi:MAG: 23S rRNA (uracil(1939)-C(5))-methyltransferase RlmD [Elusimicrobia bacterium]|nr:23S rRNA (uracil(1939)-C(5))-methyltransferase RlmD [Elusimicrobiota bacterium]